MLVDTFVSLMDRADRVVFGEHARETAIAVVLGFSVLSLVASAEFGIFVFMGYLCLLALALAYRRATETVFLLAMYYLTRFQLALGFDTFRYVSDVIVVFALIALLVDIARGRARVRWWDWLAAGVLAWMVGVSLMRGIPLGPVAIQVRALFALYPVYVLLRERGFASDPSERAVPMLYYTVAVWWLALGAFWEKVFNKQLLPTLFVQETVISVTNWPRVYGWPANPNSLGAASALLIIAGIAFLAKGWPRERLGIPMALLAATLTLTVSRSAFWGLAVFVLALVIFKGLGGLPRRDALLFLGRWIAIGIAVALVAILLGRFVPSVVASMRPGAGFDVFGRFITGEDELEQSQQGGRLFSLKTALSIVTDSPGDFVVGQGLATYGSSGSRFWESPLATRFDLPEKFYSDFQYGTLWVETGIIGLLGFLGLIACVAWGNRGAPLPVRLSLLAITYLWFLFYNVPEIQGVWFLVLLVMGTSITAPSGDGEPSLPAAERQPDEAVRGQLA